MKSEKPEGSEGTKPNVKKEKVGLFTEDERQEKMRENDKSNLRLKNLENLRMEEATR